MGNKNDLFVISRPRSQASEAMRTLRTTILLPHIKNPLKSIMITSTDPQEGKSTLCANLAAVIAKTGSRVALVDADMRQPVQHIFFSSDCMPGFSELLSGKANIDDVLRPTEIKDLYLIGCGELPPNPSELLTSPMLKQVIDLIESRFDFVIVDSPPVLAVTDPIIMAPVVDGIVFAVREGKTLGSRASRAKALLMTAEANILGVVATFSKTETRKSYYNNYYNSRA